MNASRPIALRTLLRTVAWAMVALDTEPRYPIAKGGLQPDGRSFMKSLPKRICAVCLLGAFLLPIAAAGAENASAIDRDARSALAELYGKTPAAKALAGKATAILVFPSITKAGLMVGGQYGKGALMRGGKSVAYYETAGVSYGLQAGAQTYGYAMFLMNEQALKELNKAEGFEVGVGPSVVVMDDGMARSLTTTTMKHDIYAFIFSQQGLMAGVGLQGNKITRMKQ